MKIVVLCGGLSSEREVSIKSGKNVAKALLNLGFNVALVDISRPINNDFTFFKTFDDVMANSNINCCKTKCDGEISSDILEMCMLANKVFIALHGGIGEDGTLQALLEENGIKYTGSDEKSCALAMNKLKSKLVFLQKNIPTPSYQIFQKNAVNNAVFLYPCVVKPSKSGSSVGISIVKNKDNFCAAIDKALLECDDVIIEEQIIGREMTVGILNGVALPVTEIIAQNGFYDYSNKYVKGLAYEITPAKIKESVAKKIQKIALDAHNALGLGTYSRVDFILQEKSGIPYVLEVNALPGLTEMSLLPQGSAAAGIDFDTLCLRILDLPT